MFNLTKFEVFLANYLYSNYSNTNMKSTEINFNSIQKTHKNIKIVGYSLLPTGFQSELISQ